MLREIGAVLAGYIVMFAVLFIIFTGAYLAMGPDNAFLPASYEASSIWNVLSIVVGLIAAVIGGLVCVKIARNPKTALGLAGFVFVLGIAMAIPTLSISDEIKNRVRPAGVSSMEAMQDAYQPTWIAFLNPLIGVVGVMIGARVYGAKKNV